jgi:hypothetical protein
MITSLETSLSSLSSEQWKVSQVLPRNQWFSIDGLAVPINVEIVFWLLNGLPQLGCPCAQGSCELLRCVKNRSKDQYP